MIQDSDPADSPEGEALLRAATEGIDDSALSTGASDQYPLISGDEIVVADDHDPVAGAYMRWGNEELKRGRLQAEGEIIRQPEEHKTNWHLVIDTDSGKKVALWSPWTGEHFTLTYDGEPLADDEIKGILGVEDAKPVRWIFDDTLTEGTGTRQWSPFYGPRISEGGRVWVDTSKYGPSSYRLIDEHGNFHQPSGRLPNTVRTLEGLFFSNESPESPNGKPEVIQEYREKFILLAATIAFKLGKPKGISTEFGFIMTPEDLQREGYEVQWVKGEAGVREGYGEDLVIGRKGNETIALESANSLVPWVSVRRLEVEDSPMTPYQLAQRIIERDLYF